MIGFDQRVDQGLIACHGLQEARYSAAFKNVQHDKAERIAAAEQDKQHYA